MNTSKYIKKYPRCGTEIEPKQKGTTGTKLLAGFMRLCGGIVGIGLGTLQVLLNTPLWGVMGTWFYLSKKIKILQLYVSSG